MFKYKYKLNSIFNKYGQSYQVGSIFYFPQVLINYPINKKKHKKIIKQRFTLKRI